MSVEIGVISPVPLRNVWPSESQDLTPWMARNLVRLGDALGLSLTPTQTEHPAGELSIDIVATDDRDRTVVIENQYGRSDHDHLGKLVTYMSIVGASRGVWVVEKPRQEHVRAVQWLNETSGTDYAYYLVKLELVKIDESAPAPLFTLIVGPTPRMRGEPGSSAPEGESDTGYLGFWTQLLECAGQRTQLHRNISPSGASWVGTSAGLPTGCRLNYAMARGCGRVELYIDNATFGQAYNEALLSELQTHQVEVQSAMEAAMPNHSAVQVSWQPLTDSRACRIKWSLPTSIAIDNPASRQPYIEEMVQAMIAFEAALRPYLAPAAKAAREAIAAEKREEDGEAGADGGEGEQTEE